MATEAQRAFVAAAHAVRVPLALICRLLPRGAKGSRTALDPKSLKKHFAEELGADTLLVSRLILSRVLQRALTGHGRDAISAQMAVFKACAAGGRWPRRATRRNDSMPHG